MGVAIRRNLTCLALAWGLVASPVLAAEAFDVTLRIDAGQVQRALPDRALFGVNLSFANRANATWDPLLRRFNRVFWQRFQALNPGLLRFPGGNWSHGFHFNLAREGVKHWVNGHEVTPHFRPQDFLQTLQALPDARALIHLSPIWSSPEEVAAFIAYMIGSPQDNRAIGIDSWNRVDPRSKIRLDWHTVGYWAALREADGRTAYQGTLYFQLGNEEWFGWCRDKVCDGARDHYGRHRPSRQIAIEDEGLHDPKSGVAVDAYWPRYRAAYLKIRSLFDARQVQVGAIAYARPGGVGGTDAFFRTDGTRGKPWNGTLLARLNGDPAVTADFLTLHTYMYDKRGWQRDFPERGSANLLYASDHMAARVRQIFAQAGSAPYPVMVTEYNVHQSGQVPPSSLLAALFHVDVALAALADPGIVGLAYWQAANWRQNKRFNGNALIMTDAGKTNPGLWKTAPYYSAQLLGRLHRRVVATQVEDAPQFRPSGLTGRWTAAGADAPWWRPLPLPMVTAAATLSDDGQELVVLALNKHTTRDVDLRLTLSGFAPASRHERLLLNVIDPAGHGDLFRINPWRLARNQDCLPKGGGCTRDLPAEAGEQVVLSRDEAEGAGGEFKVRLPAHAALLIKLTRAD